MGGSNFQVHKNHKIRFALKDSSAKDELFKKTSKLDDIEKAARARSLSNWLRERRSALLSKQKIVSTSPPLIIMLLRLSSSVNLNSLEEDILSLLCAEGTGAVFPAVASPKYGMRPTILKAPPHGDLLACMEMAKVAGLIAFVASPNSLYEKNDSRHFIDSYGSLCLSAFRALGLQSTPLLIRDLPADMKSKQELKNMYKSVLASELPEDCKFYLADDKTELQKFVLLFKDQKLTAPHWGNQPSYVMGQKDYCDSEEKDGDVLMMEDNEMRKDLASLNLRDSDDETETNSVMMD